uniref:Ribosomal protein eL8/eL30/eS12/Gadd45 domain-containing protein n=1 Tax=Sarcophilus harrisii TaxID=9305 RepID=G3W9T5_SARHA
TAAVAKEGIAAGGDVNINPPLQEVLKTALINWGSCEAAKALDKCQVHLCVFASKCDEPMHITLVEALCAKHQINLIRVMTTKTG